MTTTNHPPTMTWPELHLELLRCEYCEEKPCKEACPVNCSPFDFIMAARQGYPSDIRRAAGEIMRNNPLGGVCGMVCPDTLCMAACTRKGFDGAIDIPTTQATIVAMAKADGGIPGFSVPEPNGKKVAVVGGGPAGLGAAAALAQLGYRVDILEARAQLGGMMNLIPDHRLDKSAMRSDIEFLLSLGAITVETGRQVEQPDDLLGNGYQAVCLSSGLWEPVELGVANEALAVRMVDLLSNPQAYTFEGRVAVIGGGATALDCAITARERGAGHVELFMLETPSEMPLTSRERAELLEYDLEVNGRIRVRSILADQGKVTGLETVRVTLPEGKPFAPSAVQDIPGSEGRRMDVTAVVIAIGMRPAMPRRETPGLFYAGDLVTGPKTVVEAVASGKNAALEIDAYLKGGQKPVFQRISKSHLALPGYNPVPVDLGTEFFGRPIRSPFLLSASPVTDGWDQVNLAYQAGWAGAIMKTAFDNVPIHIPSEYMFSFDRFTYGNSDNVSGHSLDRVCREIERLVKEWPDRLTIGSTGGPVTGNDESDSSGWQSNTRKLEAAGAMAIEYSLSCPQGGDGTEGDIVSQNPNLTAKIIDWILQAGSADVPKLFKLTAAVTSIIPILRAIREVLEKHPQKQAGITLANSFPTLAFRQRAGGNGWDEGVIVGMSGEGVTPISYLTLARAVPEGIAISGNGGPMHYKAAMDFLALGAKTVQFCTIAMKHGVGIIHELESGTAFHMQARGLRSMRELIGIAQPDPVTDFMALPAEKKISEIDQQSCVMCGNCMRCPYLAIEFDETGHLWTNPAKCIGCSICAQKCFVGAISMRERTPEERALLVEH